MYSAPWQSGADSVASEVSIDVMGLPGCMDEAPMIDLMSEGLSSSALRRSAGTGSGGGTGFGRMMSQMPIALTMTTSTTATAARMGQGLRLGLAGGWFQGVGW